MIEQMGDGAGWPQFRAGFREAVADVGDGAIVIVG
jgi:hypothetical protein